MNPTTTNPEKELAHRTSDGIAGSPRDRHLSA
jgi:hypothetical protein